MKATVLGLLLLASTLALAQTNVRLRGTITALNGDVLSVTSRDGRAIQLHLAPDTQVVTARAAPTASSRPSASQ